MAKLLLNRTSVYAGIVSGLIYGAALRFGWGMATSVRWLEVVSVAFIFFMPLVTGYLTIRPLPAAGIARRIFLPWLTCALMAAISMVLGWEGKICIAMALPIMLVASSIGGLVAGIGKRRSSVTVMMLVLPFAAGGVEGFLPRPEATRFVETRIAIAAAPQRVWKNIVNVPSIAPSELRPRLIHRIGFPRPLAAESSGDGVGSTRRATFDGGVLFTETVTQWEPQAALAFSIRADTAQIPATTLDEHVTVGGTYFDVLEGRYRIEPLGPGQGVILHLTSRYRLSTRMNPYAGLWSDYIMKSIQQSILEVLKQRCEAPV